MTVQKGVPALEQKERNQSLFDDYNSKKFSIVDLVSKYQISSARIYELIAILKKKKVKLLLDKNID